MYERHHQHIDNSEKYVLNGLKKITKSHQCIDHFTNHRPVQTKLSGRELGGLQDETRDGPDYVSGGSVEVTLDGLREYGGSSGENSINYATSGGSVEVTLNDLKEYGESAGSETPINYTASEYSVEVTLNNEQLRTTIHHLSLPTNPHLSYLSESPPSIKPHLSSLSDGSPCMKPHISYLSDGPPSINKCSATVPLDHKVSEKINYLSRPPTCLIHSTKTKQRMRKQERSVPTVITTTNVQVQTIAKVDQLTRQTSSTLSSHVDSSTVTKDIIDHKVSEKINYLSRPPTCLIHSTKTKQRMRKQERSVPTVITTTNAHTIAKVDQLTRPTSSTLSSQGEIINLSSKEQTKKWPSEQTANHKDDVTKDGEEISIPSRHSRKLSTRPKAGYDILREEGNNPTVSYLSYKPKKKSPNSSKSNEIVCAPTKNHRHHKSEVTKKTEIQSKKGDFKCFGGICGTRFLSNKGIRGSGVSKNKKERPMKSQSNRRLTKSNKCKSSTSNAYQRLHDNQKQLKAADDKKELYKQNQMVHLRLYSCSKNDQLEGKKLRWEIEQRLRKKKERKTDFGKITATKGSRLYYISTQALRLKQTKRVVHQRDSNPVEIWTSSKETETVQTTLLFG